MDIAMVDRIEAQRLGAEAWVRAGKYLLSIAPYLIGLIIGLAWWIVAYCWAAVITGFKDVNRGRDA